MNALVTQRLHGLAGALAEIKVRVREALATELARAVGAAARDVLIVALTDRLAASHSGRPGHHRHPDGGAWRYDDPDPWSDSHDHWDEPGSFADGRGGPARSDADDFDAISSPGAVPAAVAVAVGVQVGRWWAQRRGNLSGAVGAGMLATALGLAGGPAARAALAVLAAASDVLAASAALDRPELG